MRRPSGVMRPSAPRAERAQRGQQFARLRERARWRRIQPAQRVVAAGADTPGGQFERQARQLGLVDLRRARRFQPPALWPQAIGRALGDATGATGALVGRGLRDRDRFQPGKTGVGVEARLARQAGIDHRADAGQRHARFGHVGGEDHPPRARLGRRQRGLLFGQREFPVQGEDLELLSFCEWRGQRVFEQRMGASDLAASGQEHQHVAGIVFQRLARDAGQVVLGRLLRARGRMLDAHGKAAPRTGQTRCVQPARNALAVERGGHHQQPQVGAQGRLHVQRQGEAEVTGQVAFVELVEQDRADAGQLRVVLDQPREDAFGDHLDAGGGTDPGFEADVVADGPADLLIPLRRHELRGGARGDPPWFEHHDAPALQPRRLEQRRRYLGGLAGAGRRFEDQARVGVERGAQFRDERGDGEVGLRHSRE